MKTILPLVLATCLMACGPVDPSAMDSGTTEDAAPDSDTSDAAPDVEANPCRCLNDGHFYGLYCHGIKRPDGESCSKCGFPCATQDAGSDASEDAGTD